jgi:hypothetical protein
MYGEGPFVAFDYQHECLLGKPVLRSDRIGSALAENENFLRN